MKYRKKPVVIEAFHWLGGSNLLEAMKFMNLEEYSQKGEVLQIFTLEGVMTAQPGDYIIKGVKGEFYPCKPDIFHATYEEAYD